MIWVKEGWCMEGSRAMHRTDPNNTLLTLSGIPPEAVIAHNVIGPCFYDSTLGLRKTLRLAAGKPA